MFPDEIKQILEKYNSEVAEEISSINLATERIRDALKSVNSFLIGELVSYSKNTEINNLEKESQILKDSQNSTRIYICFKVTWFQNTG